VAAKPEPLTPMALPHRTQIHQTVVSITKKPGRFETAGLVS